MPKESVALSGAKICIESKINQTLNSTDNHTFQKITTSTIREGYGVTKNKHDLLAGTWVWGLEKVIQSYFK